ncbi:MAG: response regulator, partial [Nitrospirae bacterium]
IETYLKTGESRILGARRDVLARRRDRSTIPIALAVTEVTVSGRRLFIATVRDLTEEKRIEHMLAAQYAVARILAECTTIEHATPAILRAICTNLGWQLGVFWQVDETHDLLRCIEVWCHAPECYAEFIAATKEHTFARAQGLPGRVWQSGQPCWIPDVVKDVNFPRGRVAAKENLHAAFAFPIQLRGTVYGVMEFFSFHIQEPDQALLQHMQAVGTQIGQLIERLNAQKAIEVLARFPEENPHAVLRIARDGQVLYRNKPGTALLSAIERDPHCASEWQKAVEQAFRTGGMTHQDLRTLDRIFAVTLTVIEGTDYLNVYAQDVTDQRQTEAALRHREEQLRQSQKLEAIGTLAGGIAHDFNNILTALIGFTELAIAKTPASAPILIHLQEIMKANYRAKELIQQILTFSHRHEGGKKPLHPQPVIEEALKLLRASFPSTITIHKDLQPTGPVLADPTQIHQVVMNLATNAEHAMRGRTGTLSVTLADVSIDAETATLTPGLAPGRYAQLVIADTGCGIQPEHLPRIFDPFFTTKGVGEGTGMGLAVTHGIVTDHGGVITVKSVVGEGTTFTVYFPYTPDTPQDSSTRPHVLPRGEGLVFFIDDEPAIVAAGTAMLEELGYRVRAFTSSREAVDAFRQAPDDVTLVITDQTMPECTGEQLAQELLAIRPSLPIILCTGFSHTIDEEKALKMGIRVFLQKPFLFHELAQAVQHALGTPAF